MGQIKEKQIMMNNGEFILIKTALPEYAKRLLSYNKNIIKHAHYLLTSESEFNMTIKQEKLFLEQMVIDEGKLAIIAEYNGNIIGFLDFHNGNKMRNRHQGSFGMSVAEDFRGQGVGKSLLRELLKWARFNPLIEKVCLEVFALNRTAIRLYQKLGFIEEGRKRKAIKLDVGAYDNLILMAKFLE